MPFWTKTKVRWVGVVGTLVVLSGIVLANVQRSQRGRLIVQTQKVTRRDLVSIVSASGEIRPRRYVNVSSDVPGRIIKLLVKEGDRVAAGQPLCRIDATRLAASTRQTTAGLQAAQADLRRAQADLDAARVNFERGRTMLAGKLISDQDFDGIEAEFKMKSAMVDSQKRRIAQQAAMLESDQDSLQKTTVMAPMSGVVTSLSKEEGETVIGAQSFQPTVIMTVADLSIMEAEVLVDETDIQHLQLGQKAEVRVDALPDVKLKGEVTEIGASALVRGAGTSAQTASSGNQAKDFKVTVTLESPPPGLRPGLNASTDITTARKEKALAVPIQAVVVRELTKDGQVMQAGNPGPEAGGDATRAKGEEKEGVFVVQRDQAVFRPVKTGIMGETDIEILAGANEGDQVVSGSYKTLRTLRDKARVVAEKRAGGQAGKP